jgi:Holliday junction resolvase RusA-like endonuclease
MFHFTVPGHPVPQGRPRVVRGGWAFDPKKSRDAKKVVATYAQIALVSLKPSYLGATSEWRLSVRIRFFGARKNADLDNCYKLVTDACQGVLYLNDSQIDHLECWRFPANKGEERTEVEVVNL